MEDEVRDAMGICGWDELSDKALLEFEGLIDDSAPPALEFEWGYDDWKDWLKGD